MNRLTGLIACAFPSRARSAKMERLREGHRVDYRPANVQHSTAPGVSSCLSKQDSRTAGGIALLVDTLWRGPFEVADGLFTHPSVASLSPFARRLLIAIVAECLATRRGHTTHRWQPFHRKSAWVELEAAGFIRTTGRDTRNGRSAIVYLEHWRKRGNRWVLAHPDYRREWNRVAKKVRPIVFERDEYRCAHCAATTNLSVDHVVPLLRGGLNSLSNLQTLCRPCNSRKGARTWPALG